MMMRSCGFHEEPPVFLLAQPVIRLALHPRRFDSLDRVAQETAVLINEPVAIIEIGEEALQRIDTQLDGVRCGWLGMLIAEGTDPLVKVALDVRACERGGAALTEPGEKVFDLLEVFRDRSRGPILA